MWKIIGTKTFSSLGKEPFPDFYARLDATAKALLAAFVAAQWNVGAKSLSNRPLIFGISFDHGALIVPCEDLDDSLKEEYLRIIEQTLKHYEDIAPYVATSYKR